MSLGFELWKVWISKERAFTLLMTILKGALSLYRQMTMDLCVHLHQSSQYTLCQHKALLHLGQTVTTIVSNVSHIDNITNF